QVSLEAELSEDYLPVLLLEDSQLISRRRAVLRREVSAHHDPVVQRGVDVFGLGTVTRLALPDTGEPAEHADTCAILICCAGNRAGADRHEKDCREAHYRFGFHERCSRG